MKDIVFFYISILFNIFIFLFVFIHISIWNRMISFQLPLSICFTSTLIVSGQDPTSLLVPISTVSNLCDESLNKLIKSLLKFYKICNNKQLRILL